MRTEGRRRRQRRIGRGRRGNDEGEERIMEGGRGRREEWKKEEEVVKGEE